MRLRSPIFVQAGAVGDNFHGDNGETLTRQWRVCRIPRGFRVWRYFAFGDAVYVDFQLRWKPWRIFGLTRS